MKEFPTTLSHNRGSMSLDPSRLLVAFRKETSRSDAASALAEVDLVLEDAERSGLEPNRETGRESRSGSRELHPVNHTGRRYWARTRRGEPIGDEHWMQIKKQLKPRTDWLGPVYRLRGANTDGTRRESRSELLCPLPNSLVIKPLASHGDRRNGKSLASTLARFGLEEVPEKSKYLGSYRYFVSSDPQKSSSYSVREQLIGEKQTVAEARFEHMPLLRPVAIEPNDPLLVDQWNMERIAASGAGTSGWDLSTGANTVVICVLDEGCDLTHPDLQFSEPGINLDTMAPDGSPTGSHGTACAGIAAAMFDNSEGVSGVAGNCLIMPLAFTNWTETEVAAGINYAAANGAQVISMSFGWDAWDPLIIDPAIQNAFNAGLVMCVATHNYDSSITYPATNPLVMACGASDQIDNRKDPSSPDGEGWGSNFGPEMSVVAPGVLIPTTDRQGASGYNTSGGAAGNYVMDFNGTSSATPHVAGLAGLIRSLYPALTNVEVRAVIERSAEKVGVVPYTTQAGHDNGTWNDEMGYGRINCLRALDFADMMIRDYPADGGLEPSSPPSGNFWTYSDIAVRIFDDDVFVPQDPSQSSHVERGQPNYIYIRVTNNGVREARNVTVDARITPYVGLQFVYPQDWSLVDAMHVGPTPIVASFGSIAAGASVIAKFSISAAQVEDLWGWVSGQNWHPCLLASTTADNDYAFATADLVGGSLVVRRNNLAQRNLSVINVLAGATAAVPMIAGSRFTEDRFIELLVDRSKAPKNAKVLLSLDEDGSAFPRVDFTPPRRGPVDEGGGWGNGGGTTFLDPVRIETSLGGCRGVLTLAAGSRFDCGCAIPRIGKVSVQGGEVVVRDGRRFVEVRERQAVVRFERMPGQIVPVALQLTAPEQAGEDEQWLVSVAQRDEQHRVVGGASTLCRVRARAALPGRAAQTRTTMRAFAPALAGRLERQGLGELANGLSASTEAPAASKRRARARARASSR